MLLIVTAISGTSALQVAEQSEAKASAETSSSLLVLKTQRGEKNCQVLVHSFLIFFYFDCNANRHKYSIKSEDWDYTERGACFRTTWISCKQSQSQSERGAGARGANGRDFSSIESSEVGEEPRFWLLKALVGSHTARAHPTPAPSAQSYPGITPKSSYQRSSPCSTHTSGMGCKVRVPGSSFPPVNEGTARRGQRGAGSSQGWEPQPAQPSRIYTHLKVLQWKVWEFPAPKLPPFPAQSPSSSWHRRSSGKGHGKIKESKPTFESETKGAWGSRGDKSLLLLQKLIGTEYQTPRAAGRSGVFNSVQSGKR